MNETKFSAIPQHACFMSVCEFRVGDNGGTSKSAPVSLVARSGKPIEHWFWGKVAHDLTGMKMNKPRLAIDYCHDDKEVIGYLNHFDISSGDLVTSGALVPFKDSDRATEIIHKMKMEVPYEASINFGGDGIKVEEVKEGMTAQVNGYELAGPAVIIREWPLRGVAICPYGADANTESMAFSNSNKTFTATVASATVPENKTTKEESEMSQSVEVVATVAVSAEATEEVKTETAEVAEEVKPEEVAPAEVIETVEAETVEAEEEKKEEEFKPVELSREEFTRIADRFGNDIAVRCMREGKSYETALTWHVEALEAENKSLKVKVEEFSGTKPQTGKPVAMTASGKPQAKLFNTGK